MPISTNVTNLKINELKESQYDTAVQQGVIGENELSILTDVDAGQVIQVATLPTASADELGNIYQFVGTTDANYTHGYFYECVSDGATPVVYSWSRVDVQPSSSLPSQTGNSGKFLTTDGTDASWSNEIPSVVLKGNHKYTLEAFGNDLRVMHTFNNTATLLFNIDQYGNVQCPKHGILGYNGNYLSKVVTQKIGRSDYASTDITIPSVAGSMAVQVSSMPTADSTLEGQIYQFVGATDSTYTNGHFYKCVSDGQATPTYSWEEVSMGGGSSYTAGTGIDITSGVISVTAPTLVNNSVSGVNRLAVGDGASAAQNSANAFGSGAKANSLSSLAVGYGATAQGNYSVAIGARANTSAVGAIQINAVGTIQTNSDTNTFKVANANGNFEMMSADGTIPTDRFTTTPVADGTYVPTLTISSGVATRTWSAPSGGSTASTGTLVAANWSSSSQTINVTGVTASNNVIVAPAPASQADYTSAGIICTAQGAGTLTFTCTSTPASDLTVNVLII